MKTYLVAVCKKHTKEVVKWYEVNTTDWKSAIYQVFDDDQLSSYEFYGEATEI